MRDNVGDRDTTRIHRPTQPARWKNKMTIKRNKEQLDAIKEVKDYGWLCGGDDNSNLNTVSGIYNITNIIKLDGILSNTSSTKNRWNMQTCFVCVCVRWGGESVRSEKRGRRK